jgi:arylsulfatase A-like enzyme
MKKNYLKPAIFFIAVLFAAVFLFRATIIKEHDKNIASSSPEAICNNCNLIIVAYDALQAAHVSHLGYGRETTPMIDAIAHDGVSFSQNISAASWTVPSYMSIFTGLYPTEHKVVNKFVKFTKEEKVITNLKNVSPDVVTLAQILKNNGYATGGFTGDAGVGSAFGYNIGFDEYYDKTAFGSMGEAGEKAIEWVKNNKDKKIFLFLHGYDAHGQFKVAENYKGMFAPADYKGKYKGTPKEQGALREEGLKNGRIYLSDEDVDFWRSWYDSKIRDEDDRFKKIYEELGSLGVLNNALILVISDHGTGFYEHYTFDHGQALYDELIRVPLVISGPNLPKGKIISSQVGTIDIAPTIMDILGIDPGAKYSSQLRGKSLLPLITGKTSESEDIYSETDYRNYTHQRSVRTKDGWKLILTLENGKVELYDLNKDPAEKNNIAQENASLAFELELKVKKHMEEMGANPDGPVEIGCLPVYNDQCQ